MNSEGCSVYNMKIQILLFLFSLYSYAHVYTIKLYPVCFR